MANITGHRGKDISTILQAEEGKENGQPPRPSASQRRKKRRRLNDLDSDSTVDEEESEEEFRLSERYSLTFGFQSHKSVSFVHQMLNSLCVRLFARMQLRRRVCCDGQRHGS